MRDRSPSERVRAALPEAGPLGAALAAEFDRRATPMRAASEDVLFDVGSPCRGLLVIEAGSLRVGRIAAGGREVVLYRVRPRETCVLTMRCLLGEPVYRARGVSEGTLRGVLVPGDLFERWFDSSPTFRRFVVLACSSRLAEALERAASLAVERVEQRLAATLLDRFEHGGTHEIRVTHLALARDVGSVRERVSRVLEAFAAEGLIALGRARIVIRDAKGLEARVRGPR